MPPKKNLKLSAVRLRRLSEFSRGASSPRQGGAKCVRTNSRYYNSKDEIYHKALEFRLLYSVIELITAYFSFRSIPWRGEKSAVKYLQQNDQNFLSIFEKYSTSNSLPEKMKFYTELFNAIFFGEYQKWEENFVIAISSKNQYDQNLNEFWETLTL